VISIIVPAHNEESNIRELIEKVESTVTIRHELIVINDHSTDRTCEIISGLFSKYPALKLMHNNKTPGFANAIITGLDHFKGDAVVPLMGDLSDDPATINMMASKIDDGYDVVCGSRYIEGGARIGGSRIKGLLSFLAGWSLHFILGIGTHDITNPFKMYRKKVIDTISPESDSFEISIELPLKALYAGFKVTEVPTIFRERTKGESSFNVMRLVPKYFKFYFWAIARRLGIR
jgi:glycosyltransferase involved in cell wall biosynthesis